MCADLCAGTMVGKDIRVIHENFVYGQSQRYDLAGLNKCGT